MTSPHDSPSQPPRMGGEFELTPEDLLSAPAGGQPSFGRACEIWTDTGRGALSLAAGDILRQGGARRVWLPAYCCESVVQPFRETGFDTCYYPTGERLDARIAPLPQPAAGEVLLFIHYFGHRNSVMEAHAASLRSRKVWVIEDCVQAGLSAGVGRIGHYAVASYRKLLPQPDGALLGADTPLTASLAEPDERFVSQRTWGKLLRGQHAPAGEFLPLFESSERKLAERVVPRRPSWLAVQLMVRTNVQAVIQRRCANWQELAERLIPLVNSGRLNPIFPRLGPGEVPLGFPITVEPARRDALRGFLAANEVFCPLHWPLAHVPEGRQFAVEHRLERSMLTLPTDQRMNTAHFERLTGLLGRFFREPV